VKFTVDSISTVVDLGLLQTGDTLSYVYTLTAEGTTHGFERGYDAFLGDPFGVDIVTDNLSMTVALVGATAPEPSTWAMMLIGFAVLSFAGFRPTQKIASCLGARENVVQLRTDQDQTCRGRDIAAPGRLPRRS
jgi:hypothetical protein